MYYTDVLLLIKKMQIIRNINYLKINGIFSYHFVGHIYNTLVFVEINFFLLFIIRVVFHNNYIFQNTFLYFVFPTFS